MRVVVTLEYRFSRTPDGAAWTDAPFAREFWQHYLEVFDGVRVVARAERVAAPPPGSLRVDGGGVELLPVPYYVGPAGFLRRYGRVRAAVHGSVAAGDAVIVRAPSPLATSLTGRLARSGRPFGVEVVGDPHETFAAGSIDHPVRPLVRRWLTRGLRRQCRAAAAVAYVTAGSLQRRYPPGPGAHATHYSSIDLGDDAFAAEPRPAGAGPLRLVTVASLAQLYKGTDVLIEAVARLRPEHDVTLTIVGDGRYREQLERLAADRGLAATVTFAGTLPPGAGVRAELDRADMFVLPSRTEGLPRALVEAMARGLPCLGSTAGGIPELLDPPELVPPGDPAALAGAIAALAGDPARRSRLAARNLDSARGYHRDVLQVRRTAMYAHLKEVTEAWLARRARASST